MHNNRSIHSVVVLILWLFVSVITVTVDGNAESAFANVLRDLGNHPKLRHHDLILSRLRDGADTAYVMVNFTPPFEVRDLRNLKNPKIRKQLHDAINFHRQKIFDRVNADEVKIHRNFHYIPAVAAEVTASGLKSLADMEEVESIEPDRILHAHTAQGIPQMNVSAVRDLHDGSGVAIAVCDTGIDYTHPNLGGGGFPNTKVIGGYDFGGNGLSPGSQDGNPLDENGHGTACAGIVAGEPAVASGFIGGVAPGAKLYAVKISGGSGGSAFESDMIAGWEWSITHKEDDPNNPILVISTSFGGDCYDAPCGSVSSSMTDAAANAVAAGITIFASAGNDGLCNCISWPACIPDVISVGAVFDDNIGSVGFCVDADSCAANKQPYAACGTGYAAWAYTTAADQVAPYSNTAAFLDILAPAHRATTPTIGGALRNDFGGTSAACPYAAGVAATMQSAAEQLTGAYIPPGAIRAKLVAAGDPIEYAAAGITLPRVNLGAIDIDDDSMPAQWEISHFGDLTHNGSTDNDSDGLTDSQEYLSATDPSNADTDSDQLTDGAEYLYWSSMNCQPFGCGDCLNCDIDGDGEANPLLDTDADGDGLLDGQDADPLRLTEAVPAAGLPGLMSIFLLLAALSSNRLKRYLRGKLSTPVT